MDDKKAKAKDLFLELLAYQSSNPKEHIYERIQKTKEEMLKVGITDAEINNLIHDKNNYKNTYKPKIAITQTMLNVPFVDKEKAKAIGAKWSPNKRCWFVDAGTDLNRFSKWLK